MKTKIQLPGKKVGIKILEEAERLDPNLFYGVKNVETGVKGFIMRDFYHKGDFRMRALNQLTNGNCYGFSGPTLEGVVQVILRYDRTETFVVYMFDDIGELFEWLVA